jgi:glycyl-tRNA synthetase beta chain
MMQPLLIELGTEELPVKALPGLAQSLFDGVVDGLVQRGVAVDRANAKPLYSPRRLAVLLQGVGDEQPEQASEIFGPYVNIALDANGEPTKALQGFAQKAGVEWTQLARATDAKGERFVHRAVKPGAATTALLPEILREAIAAMPIPKPMRWGNHEYAFARPVHWLVLLFGKNVVDADLLGTKSDRMSRGHRFLHDKPVWIGVPADYIDALRGAQVLVDPDERRERIVREVQHAAQAVGGSARVDADNLEQVNCLVEWPSAVSCSFERDFLAVPQEALVATMETNQKFFPVLDAEGRLVEHFIGIANIESRDAAEVRKGYERVIRPRFADAKFFFDEDLKQGLAAMNAGLAGVTYHAKLGSIADKVERVAKIAENVASAMNVDPALARRAAELSKADLQSRLVNEFPELQGTAGRYYALAAGESPEVAAAIEEAYMPRFSGDAIAPSMLGRVLAIADRIDTLTGGFEAGLKPTGNKDPFALRRAALGLGRTMLESDVERQSGRQAGEIYDFVVERMRGYYADRGVTPQQFESVKAVNPETLRDFDQRLQAVGEFATLPEAAALAAANKRIRNILRKVEGPVPATVNPSLLEAGAERDLADAVEVALSDTDDALAQRDYVAVLGRLARLRPQVDAFFDKVMVNVDDAAVRNNRLALLQRLADRLGSVAAIEHLST